MPGIFARRWKYSYGPAETCRTGIAEIPVRMYYGKYYEVNAMMRILCVIFRGKHLRKNIKESNGI